MELAFFGFQKDSVVPKGNQYFPYVDDMLGQCIIGIKNVVEVGDAKHVKVFLKAVVDKVLKDGRGVDQAEYHYSVFQVAVTGMKGGFALLTQCLTNLVAALTKD